MEALAARLAYKHTGYVKGLAMLLRRRTIRDSALSYIVVTLYELGLHSAFDASQMTCKSGENSLSMRQALLAALLHSSATTALSTSVRHALSHLLFLRTLCAAYGAANTVKCRGMSPAAKYRRKKSSTLMARQHGGSCRRAGVIWQNSVARYARDMVAQTLAPALKKTRNNARQ